MRHPAARLQPPLGPWLAPYCYPTFARSLLIIAFAGVCRGAGPFRSLPVGLPRRPLVGPLSPVDLFPDMAAVAACAVAGLGWRRGFMSTASAPRGMQFFRPFFPADLRFSSSGYHRVPPLLVDAPSLSVHLTPRGWASAPDLLVSLVVCPGSMALSCWRLVLPLFLGKVPWCAVGGLPTGFGFWCFLWVVSVFLVGCGFPTVVSGGFLMGCASAEVFWYVVYRLAFLDRSFYP